MLKTIAKERGKQMQYEQEQNMVRLTGTITAVAKAKEGTQMTLNVDRLSGQSDKLPVIVPDNVMTEIIKQGAIVTVDGSFISFNEIVGDRSKLILMVQAQTVSPATDDDHFNPNLIQLSGFICKAPIYRTTPFNREITDLLIAVNRSQVKSDYIPAISWGKNARFAKNLLTGEKVLLCGRVQSREYQKRLEDDRIEIRTAYEVSINTIERVER